MPLKRKTKSRRPAYSLMELILGAGIVALFVMRIYQSYGSTRDSTTYTQFMEQVILMAGIATAADINGDLSSFNNNLVVHELPRSMYGGQDGKQVAILNTVYKVPVSLDIQPLKDGTATTPLNAIRISTKVPRSVCQQVILGVPAPFTLVSTNGKASAPFSAYDQDKDCQVPSRQTMLPLTMTIGNATALPMTASTTP